MTKLKNIELGRKLTTLRRQYMLTQDQVATALGIKRSTYAYYESKTKPSTPDIITLKKLASIYNLPLEEIVGEDDAVLEVASEPLFNSDMIISFNELSDEEKELILKFRASKVTEENDQNEKQN
jgi:transcriptional regulator with XRE-family HTH domain